MVQLQERLNAALGPYRVGRKLGEGGMAEVFLAEDLKHNREVALKVLRPEISGSMGTERFLREIEVAARLSHPHILPLFDSGEADGLLYLVMPYVEGDNLRDRLDRRGALPLDEAVTIASEVADALNYAHESGLVHRDIKPANILFRSGHAAVTDFGIAVAASDEDTTRLTKTGMAVGTMKYMSPEQATGDRTVDARSDIYALGCILFEMLEGRPPFAGESAQAVLAGKLTGTLPEFTRSGELPETVTPVLERALAVDPTDRPPNARQFATELQTALTVPALEAARQRRHRRTALRIVGALFALALVLLGGRWATDRLSGPEFVRVAVLPFENEELEAEQATLFAGMHDALIGEMQQAGLEVIGRRSVLRYLGDATPVAEIADQLNVDAVIESRAAYGPDSVNLSLTLIDGETEAAEWSRSFSAPTRSVLDLYRDATRAIAEAVDLDLSEEARARLAASSEVDPRSYELTLRANYHWNRLTPQDLEIADSLFNQAIEIDPDNALAHAGASMVWLGRQQFGLAPPEVARPRAQAAIRAAYEADSTLAEVVRQRALVESWVNWEWQTAIDHFQRAIELNPNDWQARAYYSHVLTYMGRTEEALEQAEIAVNGDPMNGLVIGLSCAAQMLNGLYEEAIERCREGLRLDPLQPVSHDVITHAMRGLGRLGDAIRQEAGLFSALGDTILAGAMIEGLEEGGPEEGAARAAEILVARSEREGVFVSPLRVAIALAWAGETDRALTWFERAEEGWDPQLPYAGTRPLPENIFTHPRFQAILDGMGLPNLHLERGR